MTGDEAVVAVIRALDELRVPHMITGSLASNVHGIVRSTQDADFVLAVEGSMLPALHRRLSRDFTVDAQLSFEAVTGTQRIQLRAAGTHFLIELFFLSQDAHDKSRFARRRGIQMHGVSTFIPTPEDVIITKLRWSRQGKRAKDLDDARNVIAVQSPNLDWAYIRQWCAQHNTLTLLEELLRELPRE